MSLPITAVGPLNVLMKPILTAFCWAEIGLADSTSTPPRTAAPVASVAKCRRKSAAGELCSPYVFSTSWQNDQTPQAMGLYMNQKGVKTVFLIGPNYAAGKRGTKSPREPAQAPCAMEMERPH